MTVATALVTGNEPLPALAEQAVREALDKASLSQANGVLIFLSPEFARHARPALTAVARATQCLQIAGGIVSGVFTESGWALDRPAAAAMVLGGPYALGPETRHDDGDDAPTPILSFAGDSFPVEWQFGAPRFGTSSNGHLAGGFASGEMRNEPLVWQQSRLCDTQRAGVRLLGAHIDIVESSGLTLLGAAQRVDRSNGFDIERVGGQPALKNLVHHLAPGRRTDFAAEWQQRLHALSAVLVDTASGAEQALATGRYRPIAIISANPDQSLTLADRVEPGSHLVWALRQPDGAADDMARSLDRLPATAPDPAFALMFSCIGRGPYFYGGDDLDLAALRRRFPGLPVLGTYSTGQIAPGTARGRPDNRLQQNSVVTAFARPAS